MWAWRQGRVEGMRQVVDTVLCLLPFEKKFYDEKSLKAVFVGHPLADRLPLSNDTAEAREKLGLNKEEFTLPYSPEVVAARFSALRRIFLPPQN